MPDNEIILREFKIEKDKWKKMLILFKDDELYLKNRLTKLIQKINGSNYEMLEKLEDFQNRLIQEDQLIELLTAEVHAYERLLKNEYELSAKALEQQKKLKTEMEFFKKNLHELFSDYYKLFGDEE